MFLDVLRFNNCPRVLDASLVIETCKKKQTTRSAFLIKINERTERYDMNNRTVHEIIRIPFNTSPKDHSTQRIVQRSQLGVTR